MSDDVQTTKLLEQAEDVGFHASEEIHKADDEMLEMLATLHRKDEDKRVTATLGAKESIKFDLLVKLLEQNRDKTRTKVAITNSTLIRAVVRFLTAHWGEIEGDDEEEILGSIERLGRRRRT